MALKPIAFTEKVVRSFGFLTLKPMCFVLNVNEDELEKSVELPDEQKGDDVLDRLVISDALL